jgi:cytochrome c1
MTVRIAAMCAALGAVVATACSGRDAAYRTVDGGNADRGARALTAYGCSACHTIPGIAGADGMVGPPLTSFARRTYVAGEVTNTEENLIRWIQQPQAIEPGTAMPNLGVTDQDARDMAAYLYTLR